MKLNKNSISAKLFRWFYGTRELPTNLCPYFWKLVTATVFVIPMFIITLPHIIMYRKGDGRDSFSERIGIGVAGWFIMFLMSSMISWVGLVWATPATDSLWICMLGIGFMCWMVAIGFGISHLVKYINDKMSGARYRRANYDENGNWIPLENRKEKTSNILVEMIKATYHKYCPKIDWN